MFVRPLQKTNIGPAMRGRYMTIDGTSDIREWLQTHFAHSLVAETVPADVHAEMQSIKKTCDQLDAEFLEYLLSHPMAQCDYAWLSGRFCSLVMLPQSALRYYMPLLLLVILENENSGDFALTLAQRLTEHVNRKPFCEPNWLLTMSSRERCGVLPAVSALRRLCQNHSRVQARLDVVIASLSNSRDEEDRPGIT
jgi:hypothetical protein